MAKYACPECGSTAGPFYHNVIVVATYRGAFDDMGDFEIDEYDNPPDFENSGIYGANEVDDASFHRPPYNCGTCGKDFHAPRKVE